MTRVTIQSQSGMEDMKRRVRNYWDRSPCDAEGSQFPEGSFEYFEMIEDKRYRDQAPIHSFAQFTRWHGKRVLEIGVGVGTDFLQWARAGARAIGIDLSSRSVELTRKRLQIYGLDGALLVGDGESLPFEPNHFDLVYSWGVIHHSPNPDRVVQEIFRVLKPGGSAKAMLYNRHSGTVFRVYIKHALLRGKPFRRLADVFTEHWIESPGSKAYTVRELLVLFRMFSDLKVESVIVPQEIAAFRRIVGSSFLASLYPKRLGFYVCVEGKKPVVLSPNS